MSLDASLDLSRFTPDPNNSKVRYIYNYDYGKIVVYARKSDCIVPFDKLVVRFSCDSVGIEIKYPKTVDHKPFVELFVRKQISYNTVCNILVSLFTKACIEQRDLDLTTLLFMQLQRIVRRFDANNLMYIRACMMMNPRFPLNFHNYIISYFDDLLASLQ